ncbi:hypothetical protein B0H10DRAFT_2222882 [Mycena sp. CBHHK59/15]|nr:hypothetical protein B0H10DRAFT_2222882 [Mycena sp. CBHHK59/15]
MSLTQSPFPHTHRRHPSAPHPAVVVQPTRTPGLLSLSKPQVLKPPRVSQPRERHDKPEKHDKPPRQDKGSPRPRPAQPAPSADAPLQPAAEIRGRQQGPKKHQQPQSRSSSHAAPSRRRQPSPDPFRATPAPPPAKRRQMPIPVPPRPSSTQQLARSDPVLSHMPRRKPVRAATLASSPTLTTPWDAFPICDDTTDAGSRPASPVPAEESPRTPTRVRPVLHLPATPTPAPRRSRLPEPPRTAPLTSGTGSSFPFPTTQTPGGGSPKRRPAAAARRAKHLSEGVVLPPGFPAAVDAPAPRRSRSSDRTMSDEDKAAMPEGYFASSMFQNSPSPEELPPPLFA